MSGGLPRKKARPADQVSSGGEGEQTKHPSTQISDLGDCLYEVAKHLPLNSCLRSRLVGKAFGQVFGWSVKELMRLVHGDSGSSLLTELRHAGRVYPAAESLLLVVDKYEDVPQLQAVLEGLRLLGSQVKICKEEQSGARRPAIPASKAANTPQKAADSKAGPECGDASGTGPRSSPAAKKARKAAGPTRRSARFQNAGDASGAGCSSKASPGNRGAAGGDKGPGARDASAQKACDSTGLCGGRVNDVAANAGVALPRVTRLALRCNIGRGDVSKERQRYRDRLSRRGINPLLQLLGLPPVLLDMIQNNDPAGQAGERREGYGISGPSEGEELLDLGFLAQMPGLQYLRLAVPLDLRPRPPRPWLGGLGGAGGLGALAALRQLRRLDLQPMNGITSADIGPLKELGASLEHLDVFLDDDATLHWHRRPQGYTPPNPIEPQPPGPMLLMNRDVIRDREYALRVYPAWVRLNEVLTHLPNLTTFSLSGQAPFWLPMGQFLLAAYPHIEKLLLTCTSTAGEFMASPLPEQSSQGQQQSAQSRASAWAGLSLALSALGLGGIGGVPERMVPRHMRIMARHVDSNTLLQDATHVLPLPTHPQDEISLEICGMGTVRADLGHQIRQLIGVMPVRSLVMLQASWTDSQVPLAVLKALQPTREASVPPAAEAAAAGAAVGDVPEPLMAPGTDPSDPTRPGLRRLQLWSRDKEAYDVTNRVLTEPDGTSASSPCSSSSESQMAGPQELVIHGLLPDTLGPLLPPSLKRLSLANRGPNGETAGGAAAGRRQAVVQVDCLPDGLEALDIQNMSLQGTVPGRGLPQLSNLSLHSCALTELSQLALGPRLRRLALFRSTITRSSMRQLAEHCPGITELNLQEAFSPDLNQKRLQMSFACAGLLADLHHIGRLSRLESLALPILHSWNQMAAMVPHLAALPSLHSLMVQGLWDAAVPSLTSLTALQRLEWLKLHMVIDTRCFTLSTAADEAQEATAAAAAGASAAAAAAAGAPSQQQSQRRRQGPTGQEAGGRGSRYRSHADLVTPAGGSVSQAAAAAASTPRRSLRHSSQPAGGAARTNAAPTRAATRAATEATTGAGTGAGTASAAASGSGRVTTRGAARAAAAAAADNQQQQPEGTGGLRRTVRAVERAAAAAMASVAATVRGRRRHWPAAGRRGPGAGAGSSIGQAPTAGPNSGAGRKRKRASSPSGSSHDGEERLDQPCAGSGRDGAAAAGADPAGPSGSAAAGPSTSNPASRSPPARPTGRNGGREGARPVPAPPQSATLPTEAQNTPDDGDLLGIAAAASRDATGVSRDLYQSLVRNLPHTRVSMKLITIAFKGEDEERAGRDRGRAAGAAGGQNQGGGDGAAGGNQNAAAAAAAALAEALANWENVEGGAGGGANGGGAAGGDAGGNAGGDGAGVAPPPAFLVGDGPDPPAVLDGEGDNDPDPDDEPGAMMDHLGMQLMLGVMMAAVGMPQGPNIQLVLEGLPGAGGAAAGAAQPANAAGGGGGGGGGGGQGGAPGAGPAGAGAGAAGGQAAAAAGAAPAAQANPADDDSDSDDESENGEDDEGGAQQGHNGAGGGGGALACHVM